MKYFNVKKHPAHVGAHTNMEAKKIVSWRGRQQQQQRILNYLNPILNNVQ